MNWLKKLLQKNNYPVQQHQVQYAFTCGGIDYYHFADFNNIPAMRGLKTMVFYEEMRMKCTLKYLELHTDAVDNLLINSKKINVFEIKKLNDQLRQRITMALDTELIYKIASVVFFDKKEDISDYDFAYNGKKVMHWKKHDANSFFLRQPLIQLLPVLQDMQGNMNLYSKAVEQLNGIHLDNLLQHLPPEKMKQYSGKDYFSAVAMPQN
ncbi:MAG TPA: hypothetical protein PL045_11655 [Chitinophagaceae bacterium]|nr:hypothetical protein [Chitinophagaceae bacterium]